MNVGGKRVRLLEEAMWWSSLKRQLLHRRLNKQLRKKNKMPFSSSYRNNSFNVLNYAVHASLVRRRRHCIFKWIKCRCTNFVASFFHDNCPPLVKLGGIV